MKIRFGSHPLQRRYERIKEGVKSWNERIARAYVQRVNILQVCETVDDLRKIPQLRFHALKGDMAGSFAVDLVGRWRMRLTFSEASPVTAIIEDVSNHYGD